MSLQKISQFIETGSQFASRYSFRSLGMIFIFIFFSACSPVQNSEDCFSSQITLEGTIRKKNFEQKSSAVGVFVDTNIILTVSHAFPQSAQVNIAPLSQKIKQTREQFASSESVLQESLLLLEINRDSQRDILLFKSKTCGDPLKISQNSPQTGDKIFSCTDSKVLGNAQGAETFFPKPPFSENIQPKSLPFFYGKFSSGDSGTPLCNEKNEIIGILQAVSGKKNYFLPSEEFAIEISRILF